jgi:hypothetical protein
MFAGLRNRVAEVQCRTEVTLVTLWVGLIKVKKGITRDRSWYVRIREQRSRKQRTCVSRTPQVAQGGVRLSSQHYGAPYISQAMQPAIVSSSLTLVLDYIHARGTALWNAWCAVCRWRRGISSFRRMKACKGRKNVIALGG